MTIAVIATALVIGASVLLADSHDRLDRGLLGYWRFDEAGEVVVDSSGNGNNGVFVNSGLAPGLIGQALALSGEDDAHVSIPGTESLSRFNMDVTVSAWVFAATAPDDFIVVVSRQIGTILHPDQFYLGFGPDVEPVQYKWHLGTLVGNFPLNDFSVYAGEPVVARWVHLAGTYDGAWMVFYENGRELGRQRLGGTIRVDDNPVTIGGEENDERPQVVEGEFHGLIDEVRLYNRALSADEVRALFELPLE